MIRITPGCATCRFFGRCHVRDGVQINDTPCMGYDPNDNDKYPLTQADYEKFYKGGLANFDPDELKKTIEHLIHWAHQYDALTEAIRKLPIATTDYWLSQSILEGEGILMDGVEAPLEVLGDETPTARPPD